MTWYQVARQVVLTIARYNSRGMDLNEIFFHVDVDAKRVQISTEPAEPPFGDMLAALDPAGLLTESDADSLFVQDFVAESILDSDLPLEYDDEEDSAKFDILDDDLWEELDNDESDEI